MTQVCTECIYYITIYASLVLIYTILFAILYIILYYTIPTRMYVPASGGRRHHVSGGGPDTHKCVRVLHMCMLSSSCMYVITLINMPCILLYVYSGCDELATGVG